MPSMIEHISEPDEAAIYFDMLLIDYGRKDYKLPHADFKAVLNQHDIANAPQSQAQIDKIVKAIYEIDKEISAALAEAGEVEN